MKNWLLIAVALVVIATQLATTLWIIWGDREVTCNLKELKYAYIAQATGTPLPGKLTLKGRCLRNPNTAGFSQ